MLDYRFSTDIEYCAIRELAIELFKDDSTLREDFYAEIFCNTITDEMLRETGCWADAEREYQEKLRNRVGA